MTRKPFKLGSDPELILLDAEGTPISAEGVVGFGKEAPMMLEGGFGIHEDNILVEFNIPPASDSLSFLRANIKAVYLIYTKFLKEKGLKISRDCYAEYDPKYLDTDQAQAVGCSPEFDALDSLILQPPCFIGEPGRCAGGHIHIGYENENEADSMMIIKMLDLHLGIPSLIIDLDTQRRRLYGKASSYRRNPGLKVEYRTLSNFWLFDKRTIEWVYSTVAKVVDEVLSGTIIDDALYTKVRDIINTSDRKAAQLLINENSSISLPSTDHLDIIDLIYKEDTFLLDFIRDPDPGIMIDEIEGKSIFEQNQLNTASPNTRIKREKSMNENGGPGRFIVPQYHTYNDDHYQDHAISFDLDPVDGTVDGPPTILAFRADDDIKGDILLREDHYIYKGNRYITCPGIEDVYVLRDSDIQLDDTGTLTYPEDGAPVYIYQPDDLRAIFELREIPEEAADVEVDRDIIREESNSAELIKQAQERLYQIKVEKLVRSSQGMESNYNLASASPFQVHRITDLLAKELESPTAIETYSLEDEMRKYEQQRISLRERWDTSIIIPTSK